MNATAKPDRMPISERLKKFAGFKLRDFDPATGTQDVVATIYPMALAQEVSFVVESNKRYEAV